MVDDDAMTRGIIPVWLPRDSALVAVARVVAIAVLFVLSAALPVTAQTSDICDRTQQVRDAIVAAIAGVSDCADVTTTQLANVSALSLGRVGITSLQSGDFAGVTVLTTLYLNKGLSSFPDGTFSGVTKLRVAADSVERTSGTMVAVTVDVDLSIQPDPPGGHRGYKFARASSGLPKEILSTTATAAAEFSSPATFSAAENHTAAGTVVATASDAGDDITGYAITGGADQAFFSIGATSRALTFDAAPNYEDAQDKGTNNTYVVAVAPSIRS